MVQEYERAVMFRFIVNIKNHNFDHKCFHWHYYESKRLLSKRIIHLRPASSKYPSHHQNINHAIKIFTKICKNINSCIKLLTNIYKISTPVSKYSQILIKYPPLQSRFLLIFVIIIIIGFSDSASYWRVVPADRGWTMMTFTWWWQGWQWWQWSLVTWCCRYSSSSPASTFTR